MEQVGAVNYERKSTVSQIFKCAIFALFFCVVSVLLLALIFKLFEIPNDSMPIANQVLKCLSAFLGCFIGVRPDKGFLKGMAGGILFVVLSTVVFAILGGAFGWGQLGIDAACGLVLGGLGGAAGAAKKSN